jgi:septum formation protein
MVMNGLQAAVPPLVLASASPARRAVLAAAGLRFAVRVSGVDESSVKNQGFAPAKTAMALAEAKALAVACDDALVIGCDQIVLCEGRCFDKPRDLTEAASHLRFLRGRCHELLTAVVLARGDKVLWRHLAVPRLTMRDFSAAFLDFYLAAENEALLSSAGAYRLEGMGAQLFDAIEGEHQAILGLPLQALLAALRDQAILMR